MATFLIYLCCLENALLSYCPFAIDAKVCISFLICFFKKTILSIWEALGWSNAIGLQEVWHISTLGSRGSKGITKLSKTWVPSSWGTSWRRSHLWAFFKCLDESEVEFWRGWLSLNMWLVQLRFLPTQEAGVDHTSYINCTCKAPLCAGLYYLTIVLIKEVVRTFSKHLMC